ncbi:opine dehydrogenase-like [Gigantopelta aegis]|uniref:opine dehydrogenase-like n=1 Tax=Gigantopelta aegis TaxID=1735272 RepID=UPI001B888134|nr:opine dehydrogenase-like [Gigantopelta aegis]XP_041358347.1 opine dehydrogenase-like [Gigantopelta aegis]XP_041358348.1 opine dehydrogenase-like [Gigantopelta aegis]XP_041358349.1 opine dehydrogenase-like [Gigantopelta aegis]
MSKLVVLVCGGGNGAHTTAGLAAYRENMESRVLTLFKDEAERWTNLMKENDFTVQVSDANTNTSTDLKAKPTIVSKDPATVVPGAHLIIFTMPAFAHPTYFEAIRPHLDDGAIIIGMPGQPGFEFQCFDILKDKAKSCTIMSFESLPWAARILEFGKTVQILGTKASLMGSIINAKTKPPHDPLQSMQKVLGSNPVLKQTSNYLEPYLLTKAIVHPPIMYARWKDWDGKPLDKVPLFYQGVDEMAAKYLSGVADELMATAKAFQSQNPKLDMSHVIHLTDWYRQDYAKDITDKTNLMTCLQTNAAYDGLVHPMIEKDGKFMPNFGYRYLVEDVPNGLVVTKGLALIAGVKTPYTDEVLLWCQKTMEKEYMVDGKLTGKDIQETRCPQRYGYSTIDDLVSIL